MSRICVIGVGYVGLVTGACFADLGNDVVCLDIDEAKVDRLRRGESPIYEPGLTEILKRNIAAGRLRFTTEYPEAVPGAEFAFIAVGTPSGSTGEADLSAVRGCAALIAEHMTGPLVVAVKSTVPVGTNDAVEQIIEDKRRAPFPFAVVSNPEFLREGSAIRDFMEPDRIVVGCPDREAARRIAELYGAPNAPVLIVDRRTSEMIKYASNAFLATKISFINELSGICEALGADVKGVATGMGSDERIGPHFLEAGVGFGGSCFPKDVRALEHMASVHGCHPQLLRAVMDINHDQRLSVVRKTRTVLESLEGKTVAVLGLAFKPNTDDLRESPALDVINSLIHEGADVRAYDPAAMDNAREKLPGVTFCSGPYEAARGADALLILTDWNEFKHLDLERIKSALARPVLIDGRNIYEPEAMRARGFNYYGIGRGKNHPQ
jgi:UDPglucose 6-dehydrogenase